MEGVEGMKVGEQGEQVAKRLIRLVWPGQHETPQCPPGAAIRLSPFNSIQLNSSCFSS